MGVALKFSRTEITEMKERGGSSTSGEGKQGSGNLRKSYFFVALHINNRRESSVHIGKLS